MKTKDLLNETKFVTTKDLNVTAPYSHRFKTNVTKKKTRFMTPFITSFLVANYSKNACMALVYNNLSILNTAPVLGIDRTMQQNATRLPQKLVRSSFLNNFTNNFPLPCVIKSQTLITTSFNHLSNIKNVQMSKIPIFGNAAIDPSKLIHSINKDYNLDKSHKLSPSSASRLDNTNLRLMNAEWIMQDLINNSQITMKKKKNLALKRGIGQIIRQATLLINSAGTKSPLLGLKITIVGRITNRKKAMAKKFTRSIGRVPLSSLNQLVDYSQRSVKNRFGVVGIKVWACYHQYNAT